MAEGRPRSQSGNMSEPHYAAGLLEAKACVWVSRRWGVSIAVTDSDTELLQYLRNRYGGELFKKGTSWRWRVRGAKAGHVIDEIAPLLRFRAGEFLNPQPPRNDRGARRITLP